MEEEKSGKHGGRGQKKKRRESRGKERKRMKDRMSLIIGKDVK